MDNMFGLNCLNHASPGVPGDTWAYGTRAFPSVCAAVKKNDEKSFCKMVMSWSLLLPRFRGTDVGNLCIGSTLLTSKLMNNAVGDSTQWRQLVGVYVRKFHPRFTLVLTISIY